jgi:ASC-1-like (ASCH) protein
MRIEKGVQQKYFEDVLEGRKGFEVRLGDFEGKPGDTLVLKEQKPGSKEFTGRTIECELLYKFNTKEVEKFYTKEEIEKYGLAILAIRKKFNYK